MQNADGITPQNRRNFRFYLFIVIERNSSGWADTTAKPKPPERAHFLCYKTKKKKKKKKTKKRRRKRRRRRRRMDRRIRRRV